MNCAYTAHSLVRAGHEYCHPITTFDKKKCTILARHSIVGIAHSARRRTGPIYYECLAEIGTVGSYDT